MLAWCELQSIKKGSETLLREAATTDRIEMSKNFKWLIAKREIEEEGRSAAPRDLGFALGFCERGVGAGAREMSFYM